MFGRIGNAAILFVTLLTLIAGCLPARTYHEGILAMDYRFMSKEELQRYDARLSEEISGVEKGGAVPAGVTREEYAGDLRLRREAVKEEIRNRALWEEDRKYKEQFRKWPSS